MRSGKWKAFLKNSLRGHHHHAFPFRGFMIDGIELDKDESSEAKTGRFPGLSRVASKTDAVSGAPLP